MHPALSLAAALAIAVSTAGTGATAVPVAAPPGTATVNRVLGDTSWVALHGRAPRPGDGEDDRIRTHLSYVEAWLRTHEPAGLSAELRAERERNLDRLHEYWTAGIFPRNDGHPDARRPTFIDDEGRICAVGHLVERSAGRGLAEEIARLDKYGYLEEMRIPALDEWAAGSGLTTRELAMIQPSYDWERNPKAPTPEEVQAAVSGISPDTDLCFLAASPDRAWKRPVGLEVVVRPDGAVVKAIVRLEGETAGLGGCLVAAVTRIGFVAFEGTTTKVAASIKPPERVRADGSLSEIWATGVVRAAEPRLAGCLHGVAARVTFTVDPKSGSIIAAPAVKLWKGEHDVENAKASACVVKTLRSLRFGAFEGAALTVVTFVPWDGADIYEHKD